VFAGGLAYQIVIAAISTPAALTTATLRSLGRSRRRLR
jgi:hypothetical protein